jgi:hypothetical protein
MAETTSESGYQQATSSKEIAAAEVGKLAGIVAGMLGADAALGVLEQAMRAAAASRWPRFLRRFRLRR